MISIRLKATFAAALLAAAGLAQSATLTIVVNGIEESTGEIRLAVFDSAEAFDGSGEPNRGLLAQVVGDEVTITLDDLPAGEYGIKLYHDANSNGEMDRNMMGMPMELYGFSGNKGRRGPPPWADAVFVVEDQEDNQIAIQLR